MNAMPRDAKPMTPSEEIDSILGARVRRLRLARQMSQAELGERLGVSFQQVQKYERGANRISASTLVSIANALEVSSVDLLSGFEEGKVSEVEAAVAVTPLAEGLLKAFAGISSPAVRAALVNLTAVLAQESAANARD